MSMDPFVTGLFFVIFYLTKRIFPIKLKQIVRIKVIRVRLVASLSSSPFLQSFKQVDTEKQEIFLKNLKLVGKKLLTIDAVKV